MTTLAQLHDCHSCNDERSIDQKKIFAALSATSGIALLQLAGLRFGCFLRLPRCLRFAKPRYTERTLRIHVSQVLLFARYHCLRVYLASISSFVLDSRWNHTHCIGHKTVVFFLLQS